MYMFFIGYCDLRLILTGKESLGISDKQSWKMFRGCSMRTGVSASRISRKPSLLWITEVGPIVSSPVFAQDTIYISTITGRIFALNIIEKQIKWHLNIGSPIVSSPMLCDRILVAATYDSWIKGTSFTGKNLLLGIDTVTGKQIWAYEIAGDVFSSPCNVDDDMMIFVGSINNTIYALNECSGNIQWKFETGGEIWSSPSYNGSEIFIGSDNGGMFCLNQSNGIIRWSKHITKPVMASPATIDDKVFFAASDQKIYCLQKKDGSSIWDFETGDKLWSSPSISEYDDVMFIGSLDSHIYGIDINTGRQTWKFPTMNMIDSSPAIANSMMFLGSRDGLLYIFGSENTPPYIR